MTLILETIGERIRAIRNHAMLTQKEFAEIIGIDRGHLSKIERGKANPSGRVIRSISTHFNVDERWLLHGEGGKIDLGEATSMAFQGHLNRLEKEGEYTINIYSSAFKFATNIIVSLRFYLDELLARTILFDEGLAPWESDRVRVERESLLRHLRSLVQVLESFSPDDEGKKKVDDEKAQSDDSASDSDREK